MVVVESAGITDVGRKRKGNEDSWFLDDDMRLYVVADGMGGHQAGEVASQIVVETLRDHLKAFKEEQITDEVKAFNPDLSKKAAHLISGIFTANRAVHQKAQSNEAYKGMGSTVSAIYITDDTLISSNVGDSPIYLIRNQAVEDFYAPHTMAAEHAALAPEGATPLAKQFRHMLTRAMGAEKSVRPGIFEIEIRQGDILVICSDGLSDNVSPEEIRDIVVKQKPDQACRSLVNLSNSRRGHDNITVIVLKISGIAEDTLPLAPAETELKVETPLKKIKIAVEYDTDDGSYRSFIKHIRPDGVFIETSGSFYVGQEIFMTFSIGQEHDSLMINGKIADRSPEGIDVKFDALSEQELDAIKSFIREPTV
ncbi:MAG: protein phosphatase 2C domain-containing protein [Proteobacteria bacterium]|nr:protein phosphatase 2C domain-containing protein [Pseudomonadota bacterium]